MFSLNLPQIPKLSKFTYKEVNDFFTTVLTGNLQGIQKSIDEGMDINIKNLDGQTAIMLESKNGRLDVIKFLSGQKDIEFDVDVISKLLPYKPQLYWENLLLDSSNNEKFNELLLSNIFNLVKLLFKFVDNGNEKMVKSLLKYNSPTYIKNDDGLTVLMMAVNNGNEKMVELLLKYKASIYTKNNDGLTVLMMAVENGNEKMVELLLKNRVSTYTKNDDGLTVLMMAVENGNEKMVELLLKYEAYIHKTNKDGLTAFDIAVKKGNKSLIHLFLESTNYIRFSNGDTLITMAVKYGLIDVVKRKTKYNDLWMKHKNNFGQTALMIAIENNNLDIVKLLEKRIKEIQEFDIERVSMNKTVNGKRTYFVDELKKILKLNNLKTNGSKPVLVERLQTLYKNQHKGFPIPKSKPFVKNLSGEPISLERVTTMYEINGKRGYIVKELKDILRKLNLPTSGRKADLIERIHQFYE